MRLSVRFGSVAGLALLLAGAGCGSPAPGASSSAPPLQVADWIKGQPITLEALRGKKFVVVEFWATWCPPCAVSVPHLTDLQKRFADDVVVIGITDESAAVVNQWLADNPEIRMEYTVAQDDGGKTTAAYKQGNPYIPEAFIVDKQGAIVWRGHPLGKLESVLARMIAEQSR